MRIAYVVKTGFLVSFFAVSTAAGFAQSTSPQGNSLHPGDHVRITVLSDDKNLSGEFEVAPDGTLKHPLYNQVKVVGVPLAMLKDTFASFLRKFQREPQLEVEPLLKITVSGEVRSPNIYLLPPETTVADAVARAGGPTERGDLNKVSVLRSGTQRALTVNNDTGTQKTSTIESGDQITVPQRRSTLGTMSSLTPVLGVAASLLSITLVILSNR